MKKSNQVNRIVANAADSTCRQMTLAFIGNYDSPTKKLVKDSMLELEAKGLMNSDEIKDILKDPIYREYIFRHENVEELEASALIVNLLKKRNPELPPFGIIRKYNQLFHTCGI